MNTKEDLIKYLDTLLIGLKTSNSRIIDINVEVIPKRKDVIVAGKLMGMFTESMEYKISFVMKD